MLKIITKFIKFRLVLLVLFVITTVLMSASCTDQSDNSLTRVKQRGYLIVITRNSPTTYYHGPSGQMGLEFELASRFARSLGVRLRLKVPDSYKDILPMINDGKGDLAAAGLPMTKKGKTLVRYGPIYQQITQQVVYRLGTRRPRKLKHLYNSRLMIKSGSAHAERLRVLQTKHKNLKYMESGDTETEELMHQVWNKKLDYTIADSNEIATMQRFFPQLRVAFNLNPIDTSGRILKQKLAWAFPRDGDNSLYRAAQRFFTKLRDTGELKQLLDRYYGHTESFNYFQITTYYKHIKVRLPKYKIYFKRAAKRYDLDWRLLAAVGYQESHWNANALSPTGVRGLMMLTLATARQMKIKDRRDPRQSIKGGAKYLRRMKRKIAIQVSDPDRTWFALASYNVGRLHLEDAMTLTRGRGGDPYKWIDVSRTLPLLTKKKWYSKTRYGYARGYEPVLYVANIRRFYDLLVRYEAQQNNKTSNPRISQIRAKSTIKSKTKKKLKPN